MRILKFVIAGDGIEATGVGQAEASGAQRAIGTIGSLCARPFSVDS